VVRSWRARACTLVVLPVPGGPHNIRLGIFPSCAMARSRTRVSSFPTTASRVWGRYRSIHGDSYPPLFFVDGAAIAAIVFVVVDVVVVVDVDVVIIAVLAIIDSTFGTKIFC